MEATTDMTLTTYTAALNPDIVGRLAKLGKFHAAAPILWRFGGADQMAAVEVPGDPAVTGVVMPVRWDFDRDRPADEPDKDDER